MIFESLENTFTALFHLLRLLFPFRVFKIDDYFDAVVDILEAESEFELNISNNQ